LAAIWGAIFDPQEAPENFLALINQDCQRPSATISPWLMASCSLPAAKFYAAGAGNIPMTLG
jgi:hypothetical protein